MPHNKAQMTFAPVARAALGRGHASLTEYPRQPPSVDCSSSAHGTSRRWSCFLGHRALNDLPLGPQLVTEQDPKSWTIWAQSLYPECQVLLPEVRSRAVRLQS